MPLVWRPDIKIVSLLGNLTRTCATKPNNAILRLADRIGATAYCLAAPFVCATEAELAMFRVQRDLVALELVGNSTAMVVAGVGAINEQNDLVSSGAIGLLDLQNLRASGAVAEFLGTFIDAQGRVLDVELARWILRSGLTSYAAATSSRSRVAQTKRMPSGTVENRSDQSSRDRRIDCASSRIGLRAKRVKP